MKTVAIIQARLGSTRLPGKILLDVAGQTLLARVVRRTQRSGKIDRVVVATTRNGEDDAVVSECRTLGVDIFRGSEEDVLDRYHGAARKFEADTIVRITSDNPLIDPGVISEVVGSFFESAYDYCSNSVPTTWPVGFNAEVFRRESLERAWCEAREPHQREHVTPYFYENPTLFRLCSVRAARNSSHYRLTVDTKEDYDLIQAVYRELGSDGAFGSEEILELLDGRPDLAAINDRVRQKSAREIANSREAAL